MIRVRGKGPFYWGVEHESSHPDKRLVAPAFLVETLPPWRQSTHAVRFRIGRKELHLGLCHKSVDPERVVTTEASDPDVAKAIKRVYLPPDWQDAEWD